MSNPNPNSKEETLGEEDFYKILNHPVRRTVIRLLHDRIEMSYSELLRELALDEGQFNFHLRLVRKLTQETPDGKYTLSHAGRMAYEVMESVEGEVGSSPPFIPNPELTKDILVRRVAAFLLDVFVWLLVTGVIFDAYLWSSIRGLFALMASITTFYPWFIRLEFVPQFGEFMFHVVSEYSHIFFAVYIAFTLLDSYKGQTPGRYIMGIRVVTIYDRKLDLIEAGIRNIGKVFLLPLDLLVGIIFFSRKGYIRFFDYYTETKIEKVKVEALSPPSSNERAGKPEVNPS